MRRLGLLGFLAGILASFLAGFFGHNVFLAGAPTFELVV
jgi:hypothetical protein